MAAAIASKIGFARNSVVVFRPLNAGHVVEIAVVQVRQHRTQRFAGPPDVHDDVVLVEIRAAELDVHHERRAVERAAPGRRRRRENCARP